MSEGLQSFDSNTHCQSHIPFRQMNFDVVSVNSLHHDSQLHGSRLIVGMLSVAAPARQAFVLLILVEAIFEDHLYCNHPWQKCLVACQLKLP